MLFFGTLAQEIHEFNQDLPKNRIRLLSNALDEIVSQVLGLYYSVQFTNNVLHSSDFLIGH